MTRKIVVFLGVTLVSGILILGGCVGSSTPQSSSSSSSAAKPTSPPAQAASSASQKTVKIGASLPLNTDWGVEVKNALDAAVSIINNGGGLKVGNDKYAIDLIVYDDKYTADGGKAAAERLTGVDKVTAIVGTAGSEPAVASLPVVQAAGIPMFTAGQSSKLVAPSLKYVYAASTVFHTELSYPLLLKTKPGIKTAFLGANDDESGHDLTNRVTKVLTAHGVNVVGNVFWPRNQTDFPAVATKVASVNPDLFATPGAGGVTQTTALMAKALHDTAWRGAWMVTGAPVIQDLKKVATSGEAEGMYAILADYTVLKDPPPLALEVKKYYEEKLGGWRESGPYWSLPIWFFRAAVEKAGSFDPAAIDKAMAGLETDTPIGKAVMIRRPDQGNKNYVQALSALELEQLQGDKHVQVASMSAEEMITELEKAWGFAGEWK
ncbi:MAG: ABC transporter substrate-binding protein [Chloroflexi bacterium]|nr:ABC transporter substrate-binding protein [Chloroflexota bacterium]